MAANETKKAGSAASGTDSKAEETYRNDDGILVCKKCGKPREYRVPGNSVVPSMLVPSMCDCQKAKEEARKAETERKERELRTRKLRAACFAASGRYADLTFDADDGRNPEQTTVCKAFAATFDPKDPMGLVLYGNRGTGKSFHASCIANAVVELGFSCLVTDIKQVVNLMESGFEKRRENLSRILAPDLLILEDLGAQRSTEYVMEHVYDVIDGRYKAGKPMVITTNFDFRTRILNVTDDDPYARVFDRIVEVSLPVRYEGASRRREIGARNRADFRKKLGIGVQS